MRLEILRIQNFRGVRQLELILTGKSAAILGPNGTGKSSIVDAVDFLLRGSVRRLEGEGAGELSLARHAPFVGCDPAESWVEGTFKIADGSAHTFRRTVAAPDRISSEATLPPEVQQALVLARDGGHHLLTRRELLRFVFTEPASRAKAVGLLLQLDGIESTRKHLQGAARDAADELRREQAQVQVLAAQIAGAFDPPLARDETPLARTNALRESLGGAPIDGSSLANATSSLVTPTEAAVHPLHSPRTQAALRALGADTVTALHTNELDALEAYATSLDQFASDRQIQDVLREANLVDLGLSLLDEDLCPLCRYPQSSDTLREALVARRDASQRAREQLQSLQVTRDELHGNLSAHQQRVLEALGALSPRPDLPHAGIGSLATCLTRALGGALAPIEQWDGPTSQDVMLLREAADSAAADLTALRGILKELPAPSRLQASWDQLIQVSRAISALSGAQGRLTVTRHAAELLANADAEFLVARDRTLQDTYDIVASGMSDVYKHVHGADEEQFEAEMEPTRAGLKLAVEFRGLGRYPPAALHSEGHQDSMGLAFFLALSTHFAGSALPVIVLDDVVMSVDYGHRRGVANMLAARFSDRQLIVTTHDRVWWRQLRAAQVVAGKQSFAMVEWSLEAGARVTQTAADTLGAAREAIQRRNVVGAAVALRRAIEESFPEYCDALGAPVRYRADGANEAGEFLQAAVGRLRELVAKARESKRAWRQDDSAVNAFDERRARVCQAFESEAWLVNPTLHYNAWTANMSLGDFAPVLAAYEALFALFECETCQSPVTVLFSDHRAVSLRCPCEARNWNLSTPDARRQQ